MDALPWIVTFVSQVVSVRLWFSLDGSQALDVSGGSRLFRPDSSPGSTWADGTREGVVDRRSMLSSSLTCAEVPGPSRQRDGDDDDVEAYGRETQSLPLMRYVYREVETTVGRDG